MCGNQKCLKCPSNQMACCDNLTGNLCLCVFSNQTNLCK
jgi:hypothetical protein